jgi:dihydrofolate reductase
MKTSRKVFLFIAMSLDGYIAKDEDNIDFLSSVEVPGEDYGYAAFQQEVDTVIWGRKTYEKILTIDPQFSHKDKRCIVLSRTRQGRDQHVEFYNGSVEELITTLKQQEGKNIYCDGGGDVVHSLLQQGLIDRMIISIIPYMVGNGVRLFKSGNPEQSLKLTRSLTFPSGLVQLWYEPAIAAHGTQTEGDVTAK